MRRAQKRIWIIGASSGIGQALALQLAGLGHYIALSARRGHELVRLYERLEGSGHLVVPVDVTDWAAVLDAKEGILKRWPQINSVIFMAGIYTPMCLGELKLQEARKIIEVNLLGAFHAVEAVLPELLKQSDGQVALCASVSGYRGLPKGQPYGATKAGMINLAESLRAEHGKVLDIKVINPGFVSSRLTDKNDFYMPMKVSPEKAAVSIVRRLESRSFEIGFPKCFVFFMKILRLLPDWLYFRMVGL